MQYELFQRMCGCVAAVLISASPVLCSDSLEVRNSVGDVVCILHGPEAADGDALLKTGRYSEAAARLIAALHTHENAPPNERACLMTMIGHTQLKQVRPADAISWFQLALQLKEAPQRLVTLISSNLAVAYLESGRMAEAEEAAWKAFQAAEKEYGRPHPEVLFPLGTLATIHYSRGEFARAEPVYRRILKQLETAYGTGSYEVAIAATNLAMVHLFQGQSAHARDLLGRALTVLRTSRQTSGDEIALAEAATMITYAQEGRAREANMLFGRIMPEAEQTLGISHPSFSVVLERAATMKLLLKDRAAARQIFNRAIAALISCHGPGSREVTAGLKRYAAALHAAMDKEGARDIEARLKFLLAEHGR